MILSILSTQIIFSVIPKFVNAFNIFSSQSLTVNVGMQKYRGEERRKDKRGETTRFFREEKNSMKKERIDRVVFDC